MSVTWASSPSSVASESRAIPPINIRNSTFDSNVWDEQRILSTPSTEENLQHHKQPQWVEEGKQSHWEHETAQDWGNRKHYENDKIRFRGLEPGWNDNPCQQMEQSKLQIHSESQDSMSNAEAQKPDSAKVWTDSSTPIGDDKQIQPRYQVQEHPYSERKIRELQNRFINATIEKPQRKFIREQTVQKLCRKGMTKERYLALFNDIILYATPLPYTNKLKQPHIIPLNAMKIESDQCLQKLILLANPKSIEIMFETVHDATLWRREIGLLQAMTNWAQRQVYAPIWQPDNSKSHCTNCNGRFTILNRRHHCRCCGILICGKCTQQTLLSSRNTVRCENCISTEIQGAEKLLTTQRPIQKMEYPFGSSNYRI